MLHLKRSELRYKVMLIRISLVVTLIGFNSSESALGAPPHCDRKGYPSCFDAGYQDGQANPGTSCPSSHSKKFCNGWNAGANAVSNSKIQNSQQNSPPSSSNATPNQSNVSVFIVLFLLIVGLIAFKLRKRGKSKERFRISFDDFIPPLKCIDYRTCSNNFVLSTKCRSFCHHHILFLKPKFTIILILLLV
jgi:hypothetical protein